MHTGSYNAVFVALSCLISSLCSYTVSAAANKMNASIGNTVSAEICKNVSPIDTQKEIAKVAGVSHDTIAKVETIEHKAPEPVVTAYGKISTS